MNNSYVIQWKSKVNGRAGRGTKQFEKEEVDRLVEELNREYPQIEHLAVPAADIAPASARDEAAIPETVTPILSVA
jgi:DNA-directed RNA polymerase subunit F